MSLYFDIQLNQALRYCEGYYIESEAKRFFQIYPFTTENISGYIDQFDVKGKKILTVGSSGDQVIELALHGGKEITVVDICPQTKEYFYLKKAGLLFFEKSLFESFFCYKDYPRVFKDNINVFRKSNFQKLEPILRLLDYESYLFWGELFNSYTSEIVRKHLFFDDEKRISMLQKQLRYLSSVTQYHQAKEQIAKISPTFLIGDIFENDLREKYDIIWLSNIAVYYPLEQMKELVERLQQNLNPLGKMMICYLYDTKKDTVYQEDWAEVYNLEKTLNIFPDAKLVNFLGVEGIRSQKTSVQDAVLTLQKKR